MNQTQLDDLICKLFNEKKSIRYIKKYLHVSQERIEKVIQSKNSNTNLIHQKGRPKSKNYIIVEPLVDYYSNYDPSASAFWIKKEIESKLQFETSTTKIL